MRCQFLPYEDSRPNRTRSCEVLSNTIGCAPSRSVACHCEYRPRSRAARKSVWPKSVTHVAHWKDSIAYAIAQFVMSIESWSWWVMFPEPAGGWPTLLPSSWPISKPRTLPTPDRSYAETLSQRGAAFFAVFKECGSCPLFSGQWRQLEMNNSQMSECGGERRIESPVAEWSVGRRPTLVCLLFSVCAFDLKRKRDFVGKWRGV